MGCYQVFIKLFRLPGGLFNGYSGFISPSYDQRSTSDAELKVPSNYQYHWAVFTRCMLDTLDDTVSSAALGLGY